MIKKYHIDFKKYSFPEWFIEETDESATFREAIYRHIYAMSNAFNSENYLTFYTNLGMFFYDKHNETLKGYKEMINTHLMYVMECYYYGFYYCLPLENTDKMVFIIEDPSFIKIVADPSYDSFKQDKDYLEIMNLASKMTKDNNPMLLIYEFKD